MIRSPIWRAAALALWLLAGETAFGAAPAEYGLTDLFRIALKRSETIGISRYNVAIAGHGRDRARANLLPDLTAFGGHTQYSTEKSIAGFTIQPEWTANWGIRLDQSITLNGREWTSLRIAEQNVEKTRYDLASVQADDLFEVAAAYYQVLKDTRAVEIARANRRRLEKHLESVSARLELEDVAVTALYRAEAELSEARTDVISAGNQRRLSLARLASVAGVPHIDRVQDPGLGEEPLFKGKLAALKAAALENRPELKSLEIQWQMAEQQIAMARGTRWPVLSVEGLYMDQSQQPATVFSPGESLSLGLNLTFPIFDGGMRRSGVAEALAARQQSRLAVESLSKAIAIEVESVYLELQTHQSVLASLRDRLHASRENYRAVSRQFDYGLATSVDVMDANTVLVTSEKRLMESRYNFQLALLKLDRATGTFLQKITATLKGGSHESR